MITFTISGVADSILDLEDHAPEAWPSLRQIKTVKHGRGYTVTYEVSYEDAKKIRSEAWDHSRGTAEDWGHTPQERRACSQAFHNIRVAINRYLGVP